MSIKICIPTYNRDEIKTLKLLTAFDKKNIYLFPNNYGTNLKAEVKKLENNYSDYNIVGLNTQGIPTARNAILNYFNIGDYIIQMDDDINKIQRLTINKNKLKKELTELNNIEIKKFIKKAFETIKKFNTKLWGIYPIDNSFYMSQKLNSKGFIIGTMFGVINNNIKFDEKLKLKEDYDFTLKHIIKFKKICRYDYITVKAEHYSNKGGCVDQRKENKNLEKNCCDYILNKYPYFLKKNPKRENEILIKL